MSKWLGLREDQARARCLMSLIISQLPEPPLYRACPGNRSRSLRLVAELPASKVAG